MSARTKKLVFASFPLVLCLAVAGYFAFRPKEDPRETIERAIEAHGGEANIQKSKRGRSRIVTKATMPKMGRSIPEFQMTIQVEDVFDLPNSTAALCI